MLLSAHSDTLPIVRFAPEVDAVGSGGSSRTGGAGTLSILFATDGSHSSASALAHLLDVFRGVPAAARPCVRLLYVLRIPMGPGLDFIGEPGFAAETLGAITCLPDDEVGRAEALLGHTQEAERHLAEQEMALKTAGWPATSVCSEIVEIEDVGFTGSAVAQAVADAARARRVDIVLVGRERHGRIHELLLKSTGERILHDVREVAVWIASGPSDDARGQAHDTRSAAPESEGRSGTGLDPVSHDDPRR